MIRRRPLGAVVGPLVALILLLPFALGACGVEQVSTVEGVVISVDGDSPASVNGFTLRTTDGTLLSFDIDGAIDFGHGGFPGAHLREHQALGEPVRVTYRTEGGAADARLIVVRLEDAG